MEAPSKRLVDTIYEAIGDDAAYAAVPVLIASELRSDAGWVQEHDLAGALIIGANHGVNPDIAGPYERHYHRLDPWLCAAKRAPLDTAFCLERHVSQRAYEQSEIYNDLVRKNGDFFHAVGLVLGTASGVTAIAMHRVRTHASFEPQAERFLDALQPHLKRMTETRRRLARTREVAGARWVALDELASAVLIVTGRRSFVYANRAANELLSTSQVLRISPSGCVRLEPGDLDHRLTRALIQATGRLHGVSTTIQVDREPLLPMNLRVDPLRTPWREPLAVISVQDGERVLQARIGAASAIFGFSAAECALLEALLRGRSIIQHADARGIRLATARTQLHSLLTKSGTGRQSELVATVAALAS